MMLDMDSFDDILARASNQLRFVMRSRVRESRSNGEARPTLVGTVRRPDKSRSPGYWTADPDVAREFESWGHEAVNIMPGGAALLTGSEELRLLDGDEQLRRLLRMRRVHRSALPAIGGSFSLSQHNDTRAAGTGSFCAFIRESGGRPPTHILLPGHAAVPIDRLDDDRPTGEFRVMSPSSMGHGGLRATDEIGRVEHRTRIRLDTDEFNVTDAAVVRLNPALARKVAGKDFGPSQVWRTILVAKIAIAEGRAVASGFPPTTSALEGWSQADFSKTWLEGRVGADAKVTIESTASRRNGRLRCESLAYPSENGSRVEVLRVEEFLGTFGSVGSLSADQVGERFLKLGSCSSLTEGVGEAFGDFYALPYRNKEDDAKPHLARFGGVLAVAGIGGKPFAVAGDSGAPVWREAKAGGALELVGMVLGGFCLTDGRRLTLVLSIENTLKKLNDLRKAERKPMFEVCVG